MGSIYLKADDLLRIVYSMKIIKRVHNMGQTKKCLEPQHQSCFAQQYHETWEALQICRLSSDKPPPAAVIELDLTGLNRDTYRFMPTF